MESLVSSRLDRLPPALRELLRQAAVLGRVFEASHLEALAGRAVEELLEATLRMAHISVCGLMTMPPFFNAPQKARPYFAALRELRDHIKLEAISNISMDELSMGMTGDFETAIEEGATIVRIGTAIFGDRR